MVVQSYNTQMIDVYKDYSKLINLKYDIKQSNVVTYLMIDKEMTFGSYLIQIRGEDKDGNVGYSNYRISYDSELPDKIMIPTPFANIHYIIVCGMNGCTNYEIDPSWIVSPTAKK